MYFRKKTSAGRSYLQIVESRREGGQVRQHVIATLGRFFALERAVVMTVLHRLFGGGSDRAADRWREDYRIDRAGRKALPRPFRPALRRQPRAPRRRRRPAADRAIARRRLINPRRCRAKARARRRFPLARQSLDKTHC
jgi:hypothetical protein